MHGGYDFKCIPAVEVSCADPIVGRVHILGYFNDPAKLFSAENESNYRECNEFFKTIREGLMQRIAVAIDRINEYAAKNKPDEFLKNGPFTLNDVKLAASKLTNSDPENTEFEAIHLSYPLKDRGYVSNPKEAKKFVDDNGLLPGYTEDCWQRVSPEQGIEALVKAGATDIVFAHPGSSLKNATAYEIFGLIKTLRQYGLNGVEVICPKNPAEFRDYLNWRCAEAGLIQTIGGDNHLEKEIVGDKLLIVK